MSTFGCEGYLRKWIERLNIPILGIDYSLSPKYKYPVALDDCWQAYNWIIDHSESELGIKPNKNCTIKVTKINIITNDIMNMSKYGGIYYEMEGIYTRGSPNLTKKSVYFKSFRKNHSVSPYF